MRRWRRTRRRLCYRRRSKWRNRPRSACVNTRNPMERLLHDLRLSARTLWKDRSFTLTTIAPLSLCLAANVAIFAIVDGVLLKPLPFDEPERLVRLFNKYPGAGVEIADNGVPDYFDRMAGMPSLDSIANFRQSGQTVSGPTGEAEGIQAMLVTPSFF